MKATVIDLRYKMSEILKALDRRERITLLYHGKTKGIIVPVNENKSVKVVDHPFFNMAKGKGEKEESVAQQMAAMRRPRSDAV
jgi:antitoxin (DNA-binding transcriptional repressor) of toxin-antitoxin stability system